MDVRRRDRTTLRGGVGEGAPAPPHAVAPREGVVRVGHPAAARRRGVRRRRVRRGEPRARAGAQPQCQPRRRARRAAPAPAIWRATANALLRAGRPARRAARQRPRAEPPERPRPARALGVEAAAGWTVARRARRARRQRHLPRFSRSRPRDGHVRRLRRRSDPEPAVPVRDRLGAAQRRGVLAPARRALARAGPRGTSTSSSAAGRASGCATSSRWCPRSSCTRSPWAYLARRGRASLGTTLEIQNLTDAPVFDFFGIQRPGRALREDHGGAVHALRASVSTLPKPLLGRPSHAGAPMSTRPWSTLFAIAAAGAAPPPGAAIRRPRLQAARGTCSRRS